ncbi:MAG TPA: DUF58 domain-containing protein [Phycisphaerae bacterium]|nr:DUF58 domain-containing protein [Phycisphaerae bacterium]HPC21310.1 DUF58 domain-containing protein [Phycisphaerae bacterium]HRS27270.1 DUF58 domain-containing protein [Phycisphaerae bacterium]
MPNSGRYLLPEVIARLRGLDLRARMVVAGVLSGMHRSVYHGQSVEFAEHRPYVAGDDIRRIDWRLYGRKDRFFIKQYEEETNLRCNVLLDASRSMAYGSGPLNKFDYAACLAAALAYLLVRQHDAVGLITFDHEIRRKLPATTGRPQLANVISLLEASQPAGSTNVKILFHQLAEELRRRSLVVLISDLLADTQDVLAGLEHICYSGHELVLLHVMDDDEWNFPFVENTLFEGLEEEQRLLADPQALRASYLEAVRDFCARVRAVCLKHRADYVPVNTRQPLDAVLSGYLSGRSVRAAHGRTGR